MSSPSGDQQPPTQAALAPTPTADNGTGPPWKVQLAVYDLSQVIPQKIIGISWRWKYVCHAFEGVVGK